MYAAQPLMRIAEEPIVTIAKPAKFPVFSMMDYFDAFCHQTPEVKAHHRSLFYALLSVARKRGGILRLSLAYQDGMHMARIGSRSTYIAALEELQAWGIIKYTPGKNGYQAPIIELLVPAGWDACCDEWNVFNSKVDAQKWASTDTSTEHLPIHLVGTFNKDISLEDNKPIPAARAAESEFSKIEKALKGCQSEQAIIEHWNSLDAKPAKGTKEHDLFRQRREEITVGFDVFWEAYGRKDGSKSKTKVQWDKLSVEVRTKVLKGLPVYRRSVRDKQFLPYPLTFLNGKNWEAESYGVVEKPTVIGPPPSAPLPPHAERTAQPQLTEAQIEMYRKERERLQNIR